MGRTCGNTVHATSIAADSEYIPRSEVNYEILYNWTHGEESRHHLQVLALVRWELEVLFKDEYEYRFPCWEEHRVRLLALRGAGQRARLTG